MNIPFFFQKIRYNGYTYIDGAFGNPYPVDYFDDGKTKILGISITTSKNTKSIYSGRNYETTETDNIRYTYKVLNASITQLKKKIFQNCSNQCKHLILNSPTMDTTGLSLSHNNKIQMLKLGYDTAKRFVQKEFLHVQVNKSNEDSYIDIIQSTEEVSYE